MVRITLSCFVNNIEIVSNILDFVIAKNVKTHNLANTRQATPLLNNAVEFQLYGLQHGHKFVKIVVITPNVLVNVSNY